jgi:Ferritin-like domain
VEGFSRGALFARGGVGAAAVLAGSAVGGLLPSTAVAADTPSDADLAYARLLVAVELLAIDFYSTAIDSKRLAGAAQGNLRRARADEKRHYASLAAILAAAGQTPATAADIDFTYPQRSFASRRSIARLGSKLEALFLGAYLGAVDGYEAGSLKQLAARAAASEAQHLSVLSAAAGGSRFLAAFPRPLTIDRVSDALDAYTS